MQIINRHTHKLSICTPTHVGKGNNYVAQIALQPALIYIIGYWDCIGCCIMQQPIQLIIAPTALQLLVTPQLVGWGVLRLFWITCARAHARVCVCVCVCVYTSYGWSM